jgi:intracellular sulfur oxidation DsrE/DsrF family protein
MTISRRLFLSVLMPGLAGGASLAATSVQAEAGVQKVVDQLSEPGRVNFTLGNIRNHIEGKGGAAHVRIVLVVHGPALKSFIAAKVNSDIRHQVGARREEGVSFVACGHTMKGLKLAKPDLLDGFEIADEGGVVRIADLQQQGHVYIRP